MTADDLDPTKSPNFGGVFVHGRFYSPDPETQGRQKAHFMHEIYRGLGYMLDGPVVYMDGQPVSPLDGVAGAAEMLVSDPGDANALDVSRRTREFVEFAREKGEANPDVRAQASSLMDELREFADFDFWNNEDGPGR